MSCRRASLLAISFAFAAHAGRQESIAPAATHWEHTLIRHERFEDFDGGTGVGAHMALLPPLKLTADCRPPATHVDDRFDDELPIGLPSPLPQLPIAHFESRILTVASGFQDALLSWNVEDAAHSACAFDLRVGSRLEEFWSPWLNIATWGDGTARLIEDENSECNEFDRGRVDVDYFMSGQLWDRIQYRVRACCDGTDPSTVTEVIVRRVVLCLSRRVEGKAPSSPAPHEHARIAVPFRSQKAEKPEIAGKICSPTSVAMVMAYRGVDKPTAEVAYRIFDKTHEIYGNWPLNVQGAYSFGVPGYLARFSNWSEVEQLIAAGQPLVISIAAKPGELDGAPYPKTDGHLLVLCGFDAKGDVLVNDPAAADATKGQVTYRRDQLDNVWLARGGTAYVFLARER